MLRRIIVAILLASPVTELAAQQSTPIPAGAWSPVFKHDPQGRPLAGDKQQLIDAVRRGLSVHLAWGVRHPQDSTRSVEQTALPVFLTVVDASEVFVQVAEHLAIADYWARESQGIADPRVTWAAVLGTTGTFNALWYNRATGELIRQLPQRVTITWYVEGRPATTASPPLYSQEPRLPTPPA
jgi:hypothetical protein